MSNPDPESDASSDGLGETAYLDSFGDLCAAFQDALEKGLKPDIGQIVESARCDNKEGLFRELLRIETRSQSPTGRPSARAEYLDRFPEFEAQIESVLGERANEQTRIAGSSESLNAETPDSIGRFKVVRLLGIGGFGRVYQARDPKLKREVAIKVMRSGFSRGDEVLKEAQNAAQLNHEGIVRIYDVDADAPEPYIVQEYVSGESLADRLQKGQSFSIAESIQLMIRLADALGFAHQHRLFHRDLKPGNILIEKSGIPRLIDFGLAIHEEDREKHRGEIAGSMGYMAPEQFRGESHRVDDRTDIWSLCVIFYRLLTGRLPFDGSSGGLIAEEVQFFDHVPMRQVDAKIPAALDRIVGKGLAKRMVDRYTLCSDLIEDLEIVRDDSTGSEVASQGLAQSALQPLATGHESSSIPELSSSSSQEASVSVVPRGLSSFTGADADFYPSLLPGPFDRDGLPTSISFWLDRIANTDPTKAVPIGVVYGRSGCGKSSLIRAGILPRVSRNVIPVYADCTDRGTEQRIIEAVDASFGESTGDMDILRRFVAIRESSRRKRNPKVLIILDQFEQWLHGRTNIAQERLTMALRQCDGVSLQVLIVVRDDFWLAVSQFLRAIEVPIAEDQNTMAVELFGNRHARDVLKRFGMAYGAIPKTVEQQTDDHNRFLDVAISDLSDGAHVPCVTLSLFAHMFKGQDWTGAALSSMGGTDAVGVQYLERVFDRDQGPLLLRRYGQHARQILDCLLPDHGSNIKGYTKTRDELGQATELEDSQLDELLRLLDKELSLVAVCDTESSSTPTRSFQLAHDYMVAPIRNWSSLSMRRTRRGRALLDLRESSGRWSQQRLPGLLPSLGDFCRYQFLVPQRDRRPIDQEYLRTWGDRNYKRGALLAGVLAVVLIVGTEYRKRLTARVELETQMSQLAQVSDEDYERFGQEMVSLGLSAADVQSMLDSENPRVVIRTRLLLRQLAEKAADEAEISSIVDCLKDCNEFEGRSLVRILNSRRSVAVRLLRSLYQQEGISESETIRYASGLILLGDFHTAEDLVGPSAKATYRSEITQCVAQWGLDWIEVVNAVADTNLSPHLRSALADSITLAWSRVEQKTRTSIRRICKRMLISDCPEPTMVSSVSHILEADGGYKMKAGQVPAAGNNWFVNSVGMRFLRIGPKSGRYGRVFMADRETANELVNQFYADPATEAFQRPEIVADEPGRLPAHMIKLHEAVEFCNWLSDREELTRCYKRTDEKWKRVVGSDGYRIPTLEELDYAARGIVGRESSWHCMEKMEAHSRQEQLFQAYEVISSSAAAKTKDVLKVGRPVGSRLPNSFGFFDTLGNVSEWAWTRHPDHSVKFMIFGGNASIKSSNEAKAGPCSYPQYEHGQVPDFPFGLVGFRVVREKTDDQPSR